MNLQQLLNLYKNESANVIKSLDEDKIADLINLIVGCYQYKRKVLACGNGGNAALVANLITDLNLHPFVSDNKSIPLTTDLRLKAIDLCSSPSTLTGILNDFGSDFIFSEQIRYMGEMGDLLIGISGSGTSKNILQAFQLAQTKGLKTCLITRNETGTIHQYADVVIVVPGQSSFPGQTGSNNNNFHFEDCVCKISHMATGILKQTVQDAG